MENICIQVTLIMLLKVVFIQGDIKKLSDAWKACDEALELLKNVDVIYRPIIIGE